MVAVNRVGVVPKSGSSYSSDGGMVQLDNMVRLLADSWMMAGDSSGVAHPFGVPVVT